MEQKKKPNPQQLYAAIRRRDIETFRNLLSEGADPNGAVHDEYHGITPVLLHAASFQFFEGVKLLLESGSDPNAQMSGGKGAKGGQTALHAAIGGEGLEVVDLLLKAGANPNAVDQNRGNTPLYNAASGGHLEICHRLIEAGATFKTWPSGSMPPLFGAAVNIAPHSSSEGENQERVAKLLLELGAPVDGETANGMTALMGAAIPGSERLVNLFLDHGADANHRSQDGRTPLICAAEYAAWAAAEDEYGLALRIVKRLIQAGADPHARNAKGEGAYDIASRSRGPLAAQYLKNLR